MAEDCLMGQMFTSQLLEQVHDLQCAIEILEEEQLGQQRLPETPSKGSVQQGTRKVVMLQEVHARHVVWRPFCAASLPRAALKFPT